MSKNRRQDGSRQWCGNDKTLKVDRFSLLGCDPVGGGRFGGIRAWQTAWSAGVVGGLDVIGKGGCNPGRQEEKDGF